METLGITDAPDAPDTSEVRRRIAVSGVELTYWLARCGRPNPPALMLLHGAASNHTRWSELLELTALRSSCDIIRPDLRGNGASMWRGRLDLDLWASDLFAILEGEAVRRAILVGHSLGAQVALRFASRFPSITQALVLIDPIVPHALIGGRRLLMRLHPLLRPAISLVRSFGRWTPRRRAFPELDLRTLDQETRRELEASSDTDDLARKYGSLRLVLKHLPLSNYLDQLAASVEPQPPFETIRAPVLTLLAASTTIANAAHLRREVARFPNGTIVEVEADHWPLTEAPREVCRAIERWLTETHLVQPV